MTATRLTIIAGVAAALLLPRVAGATERSGKALFIQHCARCHTTTAGGLAEGNALLANFERPPADFTESLFSSLEPAGDWELAVKYGGASIGLSTQMPAHKDRLTDAEISRVVRYIKNVADTDGYPSGEFNYFRPILTKKAFIETEFLYLGRLDASSENTWRSSLYHARRFGKAWSAEVKVHHVYSDSKNEINEVELGVKRALYCGDSILVTGGLEAEIPTDFDEKPTMIPYVAWAADWLGPHFMLQGALDSKLPIDGLDHGSLRLFESLHWVTRKFRRGLFPGVEVSAWLPYSGDAEWGVSVTPQLFMALSKRGHVVITAGVEIPLRETGYDYRGHTYLLWDMMDGPFWEGW